MNQPKSVLTSVLPWILGAALVIASVACFLWWTTPPDDALPAVYSVM